MTNVAASAADDKTLTNLLKICMAVVFVDNKTKTKISNISNHCFFEIVTHEGPINDYSDEKNKTKKTGKKNIQL